MNDDEKCLELGVWSRFPILIKNINSVCWVRSAPEERNENPNLRPTGASVIRIR